MAGGHVKYRALSRSSAHRQALLRNLVTSLFQSEAIQTTWHKAKEAQRLADKLVTLGKRNTIASRRRAQQIFFNPEPLIAKLFGPIRERYLNRPGGYTRVLHIESPKEDQAKSAILELVDGPADMRFRMTAKTVARQRGMAVARESAEKANANVRNKALSTSSSSYHDAETDDPSQPSSEEINRFNYTGITPLTALNIKKVTQFRKDGLVEFDNLVQQFEQQQHYEHVPTGNANNYYNYHKAVTYEPGNNHLYNYKNSSNNAHSPSKQQQQQIDDYDEVDGNEVDGVNPTSGTSGVSTKPGASAIPSNLVVLTKLNDRAVERRVERAATTKRSVYPKRTRGIFGRKGVSRQDRKTRRKDAEWRRRLEEREVELDEEDERAAAAVRGGTDGSYGGHGADYAAAAAGGGDDVNLYRSVS